MGRTGKMWGYEQLEVEPDVFTNPNPNPNPNPDPNPNPNPDPNPNPNPNPAPNQVEPDVFTTAKALGGGVPIGAMLCKSRADVFKPGDHASTYGGNPLASAAGNAVLDAFEKRNVIGNVNERSEQLKAGLNALAQKHGIVSEVRG